MTTGNDLLDISLAVFAIASAACLALLLLAWFILPVVLAQELYEE